MAINNQHRHKHNGGTTAEQDTNTGGGPYRGPAGTIQRTHDTAPPDASDQLTEEVAFRAMREDRDPGEIWPEVTEAAEPGGGA